MAEKISCFEMTNFQVLETLTVYSNSSKIRMLIQIKLCRNAGIQMNLAKNNRYSIQEAVNYIPRTEKRKKVSVCEMPESSGSLSSSMLPILAWKLKIIEYRDRSTFPTLSKLELFSRYVMTS